MFSEPEPDEVDVEVPPAGLEPATRCLEGSAARNDS